MKGESLDGQEKYSLMTNKKVICILTDGEDRRVEMTGFSSFLTIEAAE